MNDEAMAILREIVEKCVEHVEVTPPEHGQVYWDYRKEICMVCYGGDHDETHAPDCPIGRAIALLAKIDAEATCASN